jgi:hypothetical protein
LAENSGLDVQESLINVMEEQERSDTAAGLNLTSGEPFLPAAEGSPPPSSQQSYMYFFKQFGIKFLNYQEYGTRCQ